MVRHSSCWIIFIALWSERHHYSLIVSFEQIVSITLSYVCNQTRCWDEICAWMLSHTDSTSGFLGYFCHSGLPMYNSACFLISRENRAAPPWMKHEKCSFHRKALQLLTGLIFISTVPCLEDRCSLIINWDFLMVLRGLRVEAGDTPREKPCQAEGRH